MATQKTEKKKGKIKALVPNLLYYPLNYIMEKVYNKVSGSKLGEFIRMLYKAHPTFFESALMGLTTIVRENESENPYMKVVQDLLGDMPGEVKSRVINQDLAGATSSGGAEKKPAGQDSMQQLLIWLSDGKNQKGCRDEFLSLLSDPDFNEEEKKDLLSLMLLLKDSTQFQNFILGWGGSSALTSQQAKQLVSALNLLVPKKEEAKAAVNEPWFDEYWDKAEEKLKEIWQYIKAEVLAAKQVFDDNCLSLSKTFDEAALFADSDQNPVLQLRKKVQGFKLEKRQDNEKMAKNPRCGFIRRWLNARKEKKEGKE